MTSELKSMFGEKIPEQTNQIPQNTQKDLEKKQKDYMKKQTGMKRELIKLIGGVPSIVERTTKSSKNSSNWVWAPFSNPARQDNLKLIHWQRAEDVNKDYDFAKFNQNIDIVDFTEDEYNKLIKPNDRNWNYEQTRYLWELIKRYELRFIVIMDRFDEEKYGERTVESLKDRYYSVARTILESRKMFDHPIIKSGYNYEQEMKRRTYLEKTMNKSFAELREESSLFEMAENLNKKMEKNEKFENAIHQKLNELKIPNFNSFNSGNNLGNNNTIQISMNVEEAENNNGISENKNLNNNQNINNSENIFNSNLNQNNRINVEPFSLNNENNQTFEDFIKNNVTRNDSFVYLRSQKLNHNLPVSEKIQERVDSYIKEFNIQQKLIPTSKVEIAYDNLRNNIILYTSLKKYLEKKEKELVFLQSKYKEFINRKNPQNIQGNNNPSTSHSQTKNINPKSEKINPQANKNSSKANTQNEIKEEISQDTTINKNTVTNNSVNINTNNKNNIIPNNNNIMNSTNTEINNPIINNNTNNTQEGNKPGTKEKRRKTNGTPKSRKRKNINDDETPANDEKEQKNNSKKKKKGTK